MRIYKQRRCVGIEQNMPRIVRYYEADTTPGGIYRAATSFLADKWWQNGGSRALSESFVAELVASLERAQKEISTMKAQIALLETRSVFVDAIDSHFEVDYSRGAQP